MTLIAEQTHPAPVGFSRFSAAVAVLAVCISMTPERVSGQIISCDQLLADMVLQQKTIATFEKLDYQVREHFLIVANAILSTYGGWSSKANWATNVGQLAGSTGDFEGQALAIRREIDRDTAVSEEEARRLNGAVDVFQELIEAGAQIAREIEAGGVDDANLTYFDTSRMKYTEVHRELYTLIRAADKRVATMARTPCS